MVAAANMVDVATLMSGQSLTGSELAYIAHVSRPTASEHLAKLVEARLIAVAPEAPFQPLPYCLAAGRAHA